MQIARRAAQDDFKGNDPAERVGQRRMLEAGYARVGNHHRVTVQFAAVLLEKTGQGFAADLLLTFEHKCQITGQRRAGFQIRFHRLEMREILAFVVGAAAGV